MWKLTVGCSNTNLVIVMKISQGKHLHNIMILVLDKLSTLYATI
jgi:hypothetical protein